jgi:hypothetical protein
MDRLEAETLSSPSISPISSPQKGGGSQNDSGGDDTGLLRRKSSSGGPLFGVKRRAIFVPALAQLFPQLARLAFDSNFMVAWAARSVIIDLMRNDPALIVRPVLDLLAGGEKNMAGAISSFRAFLHVRRVLPPSMAHNVLNNIAGFLKYLSKQVETDVALHDFSLSMPVLAKLIPQVTEMSLRELRRAKIEMFLIPSGALWFPPSAPSGPMFPRDTGRTADPLVDVPPRLIAITMIRISQNMLFLSMLKRNHQDVQIIRKNMSSLVLPSDDFLGIPTVDLRSFVPRHKKVGSILSDPVSKVHSLSLILSRSYVPLVAQIFRSMSRHLSDRNELAVFVDGLNRVLLTHGHDIGIVSQVLIGTIS